MKLKFSAPAIVGVVVLAAFTIFTTWRAKALELALSHRGEIPPLVCQPAPEFSLSSLDGRTISLADYYDQKKLVVSFWARIVKEGGTQTARNFREFGLSSQGALDGWNLERALLSQLYLSN